MAEVIVESREQREAVDFVIVSREPDGSVEFFVASTPSSDAAELIIYDESMRLMVDALREMRSRRAEAYARWHARTAKGGGSR